MIAINRGISVIICCYNSAARLPETLKYIAYQNVRDIPWEVIIVDNNSTDNTSEVALREWEKYNVPVCFKVATEQNAGLSYARKKGVDESKYAFLLFCDDDNWLQQDYIRYAYEIMSEDETIGVLGGKSRGAFETDEPFWFRKFGQAYAVGKPNKTSGIVNARTYIAGAAMVVRRQVLQLLESLAFTPLLTGRKGKLLTSGEDSELCLLILFLGYNLYYDERLEFIHFITTKRLSWKYCVSMMAEGHAIPQVYFQFYNYCYKKVMQNEKPEFRDAYFTIRQKLLGQLLRIFIQLKPFWYSFRLLAKSLPGSKKEIELKANIHKLTYLYRHKKKLKRDFNNIHALIQNIQQYKAQSSAAISL